MATETLRPNAAGDVCSLPEQSGDVCPDHYLNVDEAVHDSATTQNRSGNTNDWSYDLYHIQNSTGAGTINKITLYAVISANQTPDQACCNIGISPLEGGINWVAKTPTTSWVLYSQAWATNPADSQAWEWADIDGLQIGIQMRRSKASVGSNTSVTQMYIEVDYTPPIVIPTVTTQAVSDIAKTTATGNGNITATGGENCTRRGFCYKVGTEGDPTTADSTAYDDDGFGTGAYTKGLTGLTAGTNYRVRAYAVNSAGTGYGATVQMRTITEQAVGGGSIAIVGALGRKIFVSRGAGAISIVGTLSSALRFPQAVGGGAVAIAGALSCILKHFASVGGGAIAIAGTLGRKIAVGIGAGSIAIAGTLTRNMAIGVGGGAVAITGTLGRLIKIAVGSGAVSIASILNWAFRRVKLRLHPYAYTSREEKEGSA